jgi:hypothetical protein
MNKLEYIQQKESIEAQIKELRDKLIVLNKQYISDNAEFEIGEKVKVITPEEKGWRAEKTRFAFVKSFGIGYNNEVRPILVKIKKDGTASQYSDYLFSYEIVEKI